MKTRATTFFLLILAASPLLTASGQAHRTLANAASVPGDTLVVVIIGSSTAAGSGASPRDSAWAYRYAAYLETGYAPAKVYNIARGGYTSYHLQPDWFTAPDDRYAPDSARNVSRALSFRPDAIIMNLPSNDAARNYSLIEQQDNFERIARVCDSADVLLWVTTTQPRNFSEPQRRNTMDMRDWIRTRFGEFVIDFWDGIALEDGTISPLYNSGDGVHINNAGHALLYERTVLMDIPGNIGTTSIAMRGVPLPDAFATAVYPNPFTSHTTMALDVLRSGHITIQVSGILGNVQHTVHNGYLDRGRYSFTAGFKDFPPGMYFYSIRSGKEVRYGKFLKIPG